MLETAGVILLMVFGFSVGFLFIIATMGQEILDFYDRLREIRHQHKEEK